MRPNGVGIRWSDFATKLTLWGWLTPSPFLLDREGKFITVFPCQTAKKNVDFSGFYGIMRAQQKQGINVGGIRTYGNLF